MSRKRWKLDGWTLVSLLCFLYFAVFFIYPITRILISSVYDAATNTFDFSYFIKFFSKKYYGIYLCCRNRFGLCNTNREN